MTLEEKQDIKFFLNAVKQASIQPRQQDIAEDAGTGFGGGKIEKKRAIDWLNDPRLEAQVQKLTAPGALIEDPKKGFKAKVFNMGTGMGMNPMNEQYSEARNPMYFKDFLQEVIRDLGKNATVEANLENAPAPVAEGKKPDYLDFDKDGNKKEPMKQALKDKKHSKPDSLKESWTDFEDAKKAHEKAGGEVTGRPDDYTVTLADGTRRRYITKDGKRRVESLPSVKARNDDDEGTTVKASKKKKESEKTAAAPSAKQRGRPSGSKNKKKISEMTEFEFSALMGKFMLIEAEMTTAQKNKKKEIVTGMEKDSKALAGFKKRHGSRWKSVMNATATAQAMGKKPKTDNKD
jgi:hypothetical protein